MTHSNNPQEMFDLLAMELLSAENYHYLYAVISRELLKFDGKVINKRLTDALNDTPELKDFYIYIQGSKGLSQWLEVRYRCGYGPNWQQYSRAQQRHAEQHSLFHFNFYLSNGHTGERFSLADFQESNKNKSDKCEGIRQAMENIGSICARWNAAYQTLSDIAQEMVHTSVFYDHFSPSSSR